MRPVAKIEVMDYKIKIFFVITSVVCLLAEPVSGAVETFVQEDSLEYAVQLFNSGEFEKATPFFEELIARDPQNSMLNYYYGACLAEKGIFTDETNQYLLKAVSGNTPDKIFYYVGMYFQSKELWNSALKYYNRFKNYATEEEKVSVNVEERIRYCYDQANSPQEEVARESPATDTVLQADSIPADFQTEKATVSEHSAMPDNTSFELIHFQVNSDMEYLKPGHFRKTEALEFFREGQRAEERLERSMVESDSLRALYSSSPALQDALSQKILLLEQESYSLKDQADLAFGKARRVEQAYWDSVDVQETTRFKQEISTLRKQLEEKEVTREEPLVQEIPAEMVLPEDPPEARDTEKQESPEIVFKIQIGAYSRSFPDYIDRLYKKLSLIRDIDSYTDERGVTVYTTGNLTNFEDAVRMQEQVRQEGVKDALIVAYQEGERITIKEAKERLNIK